MTRDIRVIRTNASESESLAVSSTILTVTGMATGRVKVLVGVCRLGVNVCDQSVMLLEYGWSHPRSLPVSEKFLR